MWELALWAMGVWVSGLCVCWWGVHCATLLLAPMGLQLVELIRGKQNVSAASILMAC